MTRQKTEAFVPLTTAAKTSEPKAFHVTVVPQAEATRPFKTLEPAAFAADKTDAAAGKKNCEPRLSVQRDGERITGLRLECGCGQVMEVACVYESSPPKI
jgi:hypothetical protein